MKKSIAIILLLVTGILTVPKKTYAAQLYLTPSSGKLVVGDEFTVTVIANTEGSAVNTAETNITFTSNTLELLEVNQGSTFLLPAPASPNKGQSTAYFGGGLPNPGYNGSNGVLGVMKFRAKAVGKASVSITRGNILLNDGTGTTAVTSTSGASFTISPAPVGPVAVFSKTHPTQDAWSNRNDIELSWTLPDKATGVSYSFDQNPNGVPDDTIDATDQTVIRYPDVKDGSWYFHIKAKGKDPNQPFGTVTNYKVQLDTIAPLPFSVALLAESDQQNASTTPTIEFNAKDETSGVYRYDVYLDNRLTKELASSPFAFSKTETGPHTIRVIAYDRAGNAAVAELPLTVTTPGTAPVTFDYVRKYIQWPLYGIVVLNLLIFLFVFAIRKQNKEQSTATVIALQTEVAQTLKFDVKLENLKQQIDTRFDQAEKTQSLAIETLRKDIDEKIETEIDRSVAALRAEINNQIALIKNPVRAWQVKQQVTKNIVNEMNSTKDAKDMAVLRRLYDEFMNNKT